MTKKSQGLKELLRNADAAERADIIAGRPYNIGFAKTPVHTRFKPGNTAGKRGRPKGSENIQTVLQEEFNAKVEVNDGGKKRKLSKMRLGALQLANKTAAGDHKSTSLGFDMLLKACRLSSSKPSDLLVLDDRDLKAASRAVSILAPESSTGLVPANAPDEQCDG